MTDSQKTSKALREWVEITTHRAMRDQSRYVKSLGFSMSQFFLLMRVYYKKQCGISDLSEHMEITTPAASQMVDKLVQNGLIERAEDPHDRRAKQVTLSPKGRALIERSIEERYRWMDELTGRMTPAERAQLSGALELMTRFVRDLESDSVR